jgi:hypothetical protein
MPTQISGDGGPENSFLLTGAAVFACRDRACRATLRLTFGAIISMCPICWSSLGSEARIRGF